ncbi:hypothetical protein AS361_05715 [Myroides marinus]|uniref:O-antigen ligase family protein n=1 Tax=Myroides marinus TaxID=703342 RepID=UPI000742135B|nr:O-antigen ligase family protein [Myroides marinus]KUF42860.1 hypothetical protein AS361_05715 [Myroides marinus]
MFRFLLALILITCSFSISIPEMALFSDVMVIGFGICMLPMIIVNDNSNKLFKLLVFWLAPFVLSLIVSFPFNVFVRSIEGLNYSELELYGRVVNLLVLSSFVLSVNYLCFVRKSVDFTFIVKCYYLTCCLILISVVWQALDLYLNIPIKFPIETRSNVHGNTSEVDLANRLTGYAMEPSYLAPFLIEFIVFSFFLIKRRLFRGGAIAIGVILLFLTYSPSSYITFMLIILVYFWYKFRKAFILVLCIPMTLVYLFLSSFHNVSAFEYLYDRITGVESSSRFETIANSLSFMFENGVFVLFFGNGIKSFSLLHTAGGVYRDSYETSNNLFIDVFFECGLIGLSILLIFFTFVLKKILEMKSSSRGLFALLLWVDILLSSMFRADYATLRVFILFYFIFVLVYYKDQFLREKFS